MKSPRTRSILFTALAVGLLSVQSALDRVMGRPLVLGMGVDEPVTAAAVLASGTAPVAAPAATAAPAAAAAPGLGGILSTAFASVRNRTAVASDLTAARAALATAERERDTARTDLATRTTELAQSTATLGAVLAVLGMTPADVAGQNAEAVRTSVTSRISTAAIEQVAALGFPVSQLPAQAETVGSTSAELLAEYNQISDPMARSLFFEKNQAAMFAKGAN